MVTRRSLTGLAALLVASLAVAVPAGAQVADSTGADPLAPSTAVPWSPARPAPAREPWEVALTGPLRLATLPVSALGFAARNGLLRMEENSIVPRTLFVLAAPARYGFLVTPASLGDRTGMGGEVRFAPPAARDLVEAGVSGSTERYSRAFAGVGPVIARIVYSEEWRPHDPLFGIGPGTAEEDEGSYSSSTRTLRLSSRFGFGRPGPGRPPRHTLALSAAHRTLTVGAPQGDPDEDERALRSGILAVGPALDRESKGTTYGVAVETDLRSGSPHWSRGVRARAGFDHFEPESEAPQALSALSPPPPRFAAFQRYTLEVEAGVSFMRDPRTIRLAARVVDTERNDPDPLATLISITDLARLGGSDGLAGFEPGRFHDLDAALAKLSYVFPLAQHYELDLHVESGGVWGDLQHDARLADLETSYGVALRPRTALAPLASLGVEASREAVRFRFSIGGVE